MSEQSLKNDLFKITKENSFVLLGIYDIQDGMMSYKTFWETITFCDRWIEHKSIRQGIIPTLTISIRFEETEDEQNRFSFVISQPDFVIADKFTLDTNKTLNIINNIQAILSVKASDDDDYYAMDLLDRMFSEPYEYMAEESFFTWSVENGVMVPEFIQGDYKTFSGSI